MNVASTGMGDDWHTPAHVKDTKEPGNPHYWMAFPALFLNVQAVCRPLPRWFPLASRVQNYEV